MELMLDTANLEEIEKGCEAFPICGVTTNPSILKKEGTIDLFERLKAIKNILGEGSLHVQVVGLDAKTMVSEGLHIIEKLHAENVFIKVPVSSEGLKAIKILVEEGVSVTATAIYTTYQGMVASMAGASYLALYYNRMENLDIDANNVVSSLAETITPTCKILGASFKNITQVTSAYVAGAEACTVPYALLAQGLAMPDIDKAVKDFRKDWEEVRGNRSITEL